MATALKIITATLGELGVVDNGQVPEDGDLSVCLGALNTLADAWITDRGYAYTANMVSIALPANTASRTIGPGMQINCPRPVRIEDPGSYVHVGSLDYPLSVITQPEYNAIVLKTVAGPWPQFVMFDGSAPTGICYFWPLGACTINLMLLHQEPQFSTLLTDVTLPPGYERAFKYALLMEVAGMFGKVPTQIQARNASTSNRAIKRSNFNVPQMRMPAGQPSYPGWVRIKGG